MRGRDRARGVGRRSTLPAPRARSLAFVLLPFVVACPPRPYVVTEPPSVTRDKTAHDTPTRVMQWYDDFWPAVTNLNIPVAWTLADTQEERTFAESMQSLLDGNDAEADSGVATLLAARDSLVRNAARITHGAILSLHGDWRRLDDDVRTLGAAPSPANDAAGVAAWATAFREIRSAPAFTDSVVTLPLSRTPSGIPVVTVEINGHRKQFWLDTGSSISIVASTVAAECGVSPIARDTLELLTAVGRIPAQPTAIRDFRVGALRVRDLPAMLVDATRFTLRTQRTADGAASDSVSTVMTQIDGVIGFDVIRQLDLTIDDVHRRVIVRRPVLRPTDRHQHPRNLFWFGVPIVTLVTERGTTVHLSLDTGAEETYGTRTLVPKAGAHVVAGERRTVHGFGGTASARGLVIPRLRLFADTVPLLFQHVFLYTARYPTIFELDGTLGSDAGRGGSVHIDMTNGRFEIGPS